MQDHGVLRAVPSAHSQSHRNKTQTPPVLSYQKAHQKAGGEGSVCILRVPGKVEERKVFILLTCSQGVSKKPFKRNPRPGRSSLELLLIGQTLELDQGEKLKVIHVCQRVLQTGTSKEGRNTI